MKQLLSGSTPDITPMQALAVALVTLAHATMGTLAVFGVTLNAAQMAAVEGQVVAVFTVLVAADAFIRRGRAKVEAAKIIMPED